MAVVESQSPNLRKLSWFIDHKPHAVWDQFSPDQQDQMVRDDLSAGVTVSMVLVALIAAGMLLSMITVAGIVATQ